MRRDRVHHLAAGLARGHALGVGVETGDVGVPAVRQLAAQAPAQLGGQFGEGLRIAVQTAVPFGLRLRAALPGLVEMLQRGLGHQEIGFRRPAQVFLGGLDVVLAQRRAVRLVAVLLGRAVADVGAHQDQAGPRGFRHGVVQCLVDRRDVVAVINLDRLPAVRLEAFGAILGEGDVGAGGQGDVVVVVQAHQLAQLEMAGQRGGLGGHAFHQVAVADDGPGAMVDHGVAVAVVGGRQLRFADRHAHRVGQALAERPGGDLHARRVAVLGMARRLAAPLAELPDVVQRQVVAGDVQQAVEQGRAVAGGKHEAVAIRPVRIGRMELHVLRPQHVGHRRGVQRQAGMAAVGLLHHVHRQEAERVDALLVEVVGHDGFSDGMDAMRRRLPPTAGGRCPPYAMAASTIFWASSSRLCRCCSSLKLSA